MLNVSLRKNVVAALVGTAAILALSVTPADAAFKVYISDNPANAPGPAGNNTLVCDENIGGCSGIDLAAPNPGRIAWTGSLGVWSFVLVGAVSKSAAAGPLTMADLNFQLVSSAPGDLFIWMTDTGFTGPLNTGVNANLAGNGQNGNVSARGWASTTNTEFALGLPLLFDCPAAIPFNNSNFSCSASGTTPASGPFSITQRITVHHNTAGASSGDLLLTAVPEPASLTLLGFGLVGIAARARRRFQKK